MPFDIRLLRHAIAAADHGSFYKAARALGVEQSTLSRNVARLERVIGVQIFERSRSGVSATIAGKDFIRGARPMVAGADKLIAVTRAAGQGRAGGLMIGHYCSLSAGNLRATVIGWRGAHPDVDLDGVEAERAVLLAGLDIGEIDIAILAGKRTTTAIDVSRSGASAYWSHYLPAIPWPNARQCIGPICAVSVFFSPQRTPARKSATCYSAACPS
jgi:DNA-binding transcriptional LysR family regulator